MAKATIFGANGAHEIEITEKIYEAAHDAKCSVPQYLQREFGKDVDVKAHGSVFNQLLAQNNMSLTRDPATGLGSAVLRDVLNGMSAATTREAIPASRILMPAAILELMEINRAANYATDLAAFAKLIAVDTSIAGSRFEQPVFDASNADEQEVSRIGQLQTPNLVGKLTVADRAGSIPTYSYGLEISDEAVKAMTIDQVAIYLNRMASAQAVAQMDNHIHNLVLGNMDMVGQTALQSVKAKTFDTEASGKLTRRAYVKWLRANHRHRNISHILCDESTYFKIEDVYTKTVELGGSSPATLRITDPNVLAHTPKPLNFTVTEPQIFIVNDGVIPTDTLVGIDSRFAIARIRNSEANYQATEQMIMRKGTAMRFDEGSAVYRLDDTAWSVLDLTA